MLKEINLRNIKKLKVRTAAFTLVATSMFSLAGCGSALN